MSLGLIGGGYWGKNLIREFNKIGFLSMICEINNNLIKTYKDDYPHITITKNWEEMLNSDITAVCISLPAEMHYQYAVDALNKGKDVYIEKPITLNIKEAEELVELAKQKNKILMVGHLLHYHSAVIKIKEILPTLGKIKQITANRLNLGIFRTNENVLWSFAPHDISVILSLCMINNTMNNCVTGDSKTVFESLRTRRAPEHSETVLPFLNGGSHNLPDWVVCNGNGVLTNNIHDITNSIMMINDIYVNINVSWLNPYKEQKMAIVCEKGMIVFDDMSDNKLKIYKDYLKWTNDVNPSPVANKTDAVIIELNNITPLENECRHFMECCIKRNKPITDGEEGLRVLKVLDMLSNSLKTGNKIIPSKHNYFAHETAIIDDGAIIKEGTKIWHYSHICKGAIIGKNCNIGQNVFIAGGAVIGDNCKVQNNVSIYAGVKAGNYVFFGPSCVLTNDINPRGMYSKNGQYIETIIEDGVTLGANCTIVCGNTIREHSLIGAGAVVCKDVDAYNVMVGNPAKSIGTIDIYGNINHYNE